MATTVLSLRLCLSLGLGLGVVSLASPAPAASPARRPLTAADAAAGKPLYLSECSACHGEHGDGAGPAAAFLDPRPRDFTKARFKYRSTESGTPPTTADVLRTIEHGLPGRSMPSFADLPESQRRQLAAYTLQLAGLLEGPEPQPIPDPGPPPPVTPELLAKGRQLYGDAGCATCHGDSGKGDGTSAKDLKDGDGRPIKPRDFTEGLYAGGGAPRDIFIRLASGMDGGPMPSYRDAIDPPDLWAITHYVLSLREPQPPPSYPADPLAAGRVVAEKRACRACHLLDDGRGGAVGPDLRASAQQRSTEWLRAFLKAPRAAGVLDPARIYRMPDPRLGDADIELLVAYMAALGDAPQPTVTPARRRQRLPRSSSQPRIPRGGAE